MPTSHPKVCLLVREDLLSRSDVATAVDEVRRTAIELDVHAPTSSEALTSGIARAIEEGADRIVVGGGDGTLNAAADALMSTGSREDITLGLVPLGTGNDFARSAGIDANDPTAALMLACTGRPTRIG